jgi:hypothetical protein
LAYLAWLWESCVKQILDEVRVLQDPSVKQPLESVVDRKWLCQLDAFPCSRNTPCRLD